MQGSVLSAPSKLSTVACYQPDSSITVTIMAVAGFTVLLSPGLVSCFNLLSSAVTNTGQLSRCRLFLSSSHNAVSKQCFQWHLGYCKVHMEVWTCDVMAGACIWQGPAQDVKISLHVTVTQCSAETSYMYTSTKQQGILVGEHAPGDLRALPVASKDRKRLPKIDCMYSTRINNMPCRPKALTQNSCWPLGTLKEVLN